MTWGESQLKKMVHDEAQTKQSLPHAYLKHLESLTPKQRQESQQLLFKVFWEEYPTIENAQSAPPAVIFEILRAMDECPKGNQWQVRNQEFLNVLMRDGSQPVFFYFFSKLTDDKNLSKEYEQKFNAEAERLKIENEKKQKEQRQAQALQQKLERAEKERENQRKRLQEKEKEMQAILQAQMQAKAHQEALTQEKAKEKQTKEKTQVQTQILPKNTFSSFRIPAQYYPSKDTIVITLQVLILFLYSAGAGYLLTRFFGYKPWVAYSTATGTLTTAFFVGKHRHSEAQQKKLAGLRKAENDLINSPTWEPGLFINVVAELLKLQGACLQNLTSNNEKIDFLKNIIKFKQMIDLIYTQENGGKKKVIDSNSFLACMRELITQIETMHGLEQAAHSSMFLSGEIDENASDISQEGKALNRYILNARDARRNKNPLGEEILNLIKKDKSIATIYTKLYSHEPKTKPVLKCNK